jgi:hypothetical protein
MTAKKGSIAQLEASVGCAVHVLAFEDSEKIVANEFDGEDELCSERVICSLVDTYSLARISFPGRGPYCTHLNCFDIETFFSLKMDTCPLCESFLDPATLYVDRLFLALIRISTHYSPPANKVTFFDDLTFSFGDGNGSSQSGSTACADDTINLDR